MLTSNIHERNLATSTALSRYYVPAMITPLDVVSVLNSARISFVLVGLHGLAGWMDEPRATQDVDVMVASRHHKRALKALLEAFPNLEPVDGDVVTQLRDRKTHDVLIDMIRPVQQPHREIFKHTKTIVFRGQTYRIPSLEIALVLKFAAMVSLNRPEEDKHQDAHDFIRMVKANAKINANSASFLGDLVYPCVGKEMLDMIQRARSGEKLNL